MSKLIAGAVTKTARKGAKISVAMLLDRVESLGKTYMDYKTLQERERTARTHIAANRDVSIEAIRAQRDLLLAAIKSGADIRKTGIEAHMRALDRAIEKGDADTVHKALEGIVQIVKSPAFADVAEMHAKLSKPNFRLEFGAAADS